MFKKFFLAQFFLLLLLKSVSAAKVEEINISGNERISKDTIIIFDEYFNYPNWQQHEFRAFQEFTNKHSVNYDYIGFTPQSEVAIKIL